MKPEFHTLLKDALYELDRVIERCTEHDDNATWEELLAIDRARDELSIAIDHADPEDELTA